MHGICTVSYILEEAERENFCFNSMSHLMPFTGLFTCVRRFIFCMGKAESEYKTRVTFPSKIISNFLQITKIQTKELNKIK